MPPAASLAPVYPDDWRALVFWHRRFRTVLAIGTLVVVAAYWATTRVDSGRLP